MERKFKEALAHRRSYYALSNKSLISDEEIENIVKFAVKNIPYSLVAICALVDTVLCFVQECWNPCQTKVQKWDRSWSTVR